MYKLKNTIIIKKYQYKYLPIISGIYRHVRSVQGSIHGLVILKGLVLLEQIYILQKT